MYGIYLFWITIWILSLTAECGNYCGSDAQCSCLNHRSLQNCVGLDLVSFPEYRSDTRDLVESLSLQNNRIEFMDLQLLSEHLPNLRYIDVSDQIHLNCVRIKKLPGDPSIKLVGFCSNDQIIMQTLFMSPSTTQLSSSVTRDWLVANERSSSAINTRHNPTPAPRKDNWNAVRKIAKILQKLPRKTPFPSSSLNPSTVKQLASTFTPYMANKASVNPTRTAISDIQNDKPEQTNSSSQNMDMTNVGNFNKTAVINALEEIKLMPQLGLVIGIVLTCSLLVISAAVILYKIMLNICSKCICKQCNSFICCCCIKKRKVKLSPPPSVDVSLNQSHFEIESLGMCSSSIMKPLDEETSFVKKLD